MGVSWVSMKFCAPLALVDDFRSFAIVSWIAEQLPKRDLASVPIIIGVNKIDECSDDEAVAEALRCVARGARHPGGSRGTTSDRNHQVTDWFWTRLRDFWHQKKTRVARLSNDQTRLLGSGSG
jgi:hypothetical protein